jgi:heat-inducible transcriptional repressor
MTVPRLDERRSDVLKSLIQLHIATGEPVGSESLSRLLKQKLSPATVRSIMADLERLGYLDHPHTSAGRLPTDEGYRVYVDSLMGWRPLGEAEASTIEEAIAASDATPTKVLAAASHLLSHLSRNVGFVIAPDIARSRFRHVDLVRLPHPRILVVMVTLAGLVTNKMIEVDEEITQDELQACANFLNLHFAGMRLSSIRARLLELMKEEKALYDSLLSRVVAVGERAFAADEQAEGSVYLDGTAHMLDKPEFGDFERMRSLFRTFEEKSRLVKILTACISGEGVRVIIGHENPVPDLQDMALVTAGCPEDDGAAWGLGVMGSTRMEYARIVSLVDCVARSLSKALEELRG